MGYLGGGCGMGEPCGGPRWGATAWLANLGLVVAQTKFLWLGLVLLGASLLAGGRCASRRCLGCYRLSLLAAFWLAFTGMLQLDLRPLGDPCLGCCRLACLVCCWLFCRVLLAAAWLTAALLPVAWRAAT